MSVFVIVLSPPPAEDKKLTYTLRQFCERVPISRTEFYRLDRCGYFDSLKSPLKNKFSVLRVEEWINGRTSTPMQLRRSA